MGLNSHTTQKLGQAVKISIDKAIGKYASIIRQNTWFLTLSFFLKVEKFIRKLNETAWRQLLDRNV